MADVRVVPNVVISDPSTPSQIAAVDASGRLSVSLTASSATVTVDSELPAAAALADGASNPTAPMVGADLLVWNGATWDRAKSAAAAQDSTGTGIQAVGMQAQLDDVSTSTVTENQFANLRLSSRRALLVEGVASGTNLNVNLAASAATVTVDSELPAAAALADATANPTTTSVGAFAMGFNGTTWDRLQVDGSKFLKIAIAASTATVTVDTELPAAAALADATSNPTVPGVGGFMMGYNGTTWDRVRTANTGRLQVDVVTGGSADTPTNPVVVATTQSALAAGSATTTALRSVDLGGTTKKLTKVVCWSSVAFKAEIDTVSNGTPTTVVVGGGQAAMPFIYEPPGARTGRNYHSTVFSANAGFDGFQVLMTNLDASEAADVYCAIYYED